MSEQPRSAPLKRAGVIAAVRTFCPPDVAADVEASVEAWHERRVALEVELATERERIAEQIKALDVQVPATKRPASVGQYRSQVLAVVEGRGGVAV